MTDLALKVLDKYGLPTLIALGLGALLWQQMQAATEERAEHTVVLLDRLYDLQVKVERCAK